MILHKYNKIIKKITNKNKNHYVSPNYFLLLNKQYLLKIFIYIKNLLLCLQHKIINN